MSSPHRLALRTLAAFLAAAPGACSGDGTAAGPTSAPVIVTTTALSPGRVGQDYTEQLTATGGTGGYTWDVTAGVLPPGLSLGSSGLLVGTPTSAGTWDFTVRASSAGRSGSASLTLTVDPEPVVVRTTTLPRAWVDHEYDQQLEASGGTGRYEWTLVAGGLPAGMSLGAGGRLSGTPTAETAVSFTVEATSGREAGTGNLSLAVGRAACAVSPQPEPPSPATSWEWTKVAEPLGFTDNTWVRVDPEDENVWYAGGASGLFVTHDGGASWSRPVAEYSQSPAELDRDDPCTAYAIQTKFAFTEPLGESYSRLLRSRDRGRTWTTVYDVPVGYIRSIHVGRSRPGLLLIGVQISPGETAESDRFYRSVDHGVSWTAQAMDGAQRQLIPWDIEEDVDGVLYAGTEIADHPQPYDPPFFRSLDDGLTWEDLSGLLPWHVVAIQTHPATTRVHALTEGAGVYVAAGADLGWRLLSDAPLTLALLLDPRVPDRLYGGTHVFGGRPGGVFVSSDGGSTFTAAGLQGIVVGGLALGHEGRVLFAAGYQAGIWRATVPGY